MSTRRLAIGLVVVGLFALTVWLGSRESARDVSPALPTLDRPRVEGKSAKPRPAEALAGPTGSILVRVVSEESGEPIEGARVAATEVPPKGASRRRWGIEAFTDDSGSVEIAAPAGLVNIRITAAGRFRSFRKVEVAVDAAAAAEFILPRLAALPVRVVERGSGRPLAGVVVSAYRGDTVETDAEGRATIPGLGEKAGLGFRSAWHVELRERVENLVPGPNPEREFSLVPAGRISGQVLDEDGRPVEGAWVSTVWRAIRQAHDGDSRKDPNPLLSGPDGRFRIDGVAPEPGARVFVVLPNRASGASEPVAVVAGRETEGVVVRLESTFTVRFRLRTESGAELPPVSAWIHQDPDDALAPVPGIRTGQSTGIGARDGVLEIPGLFPRRYRISLRSAGWVTRHFRGDEIFTAADGNLREIEVVLERGAFIAGRVLDAAGRPVAEGLILATFEPEPGAYRYYTNSGPIGPDGAFRVSGLTPGKYTLVVRNKNRTEILERKGVPTGTENLVLSPPEGGAVAGDVLTPDGAPVRFATVLAFREEDGRGVGAGSGGVVWGSAPDGRYRIDLLPGAWWLLVVGRGPEAAPAAVRVEVGAGTTEVPAITMARGTRISGTVTSETGPVADALVIAHPFPISDATPHHFRTDVGACLRAQSDKKGRFLFTGAGLGKWTVRAYHPDWLPVRKALVLEKAGTEVTAELRLPPGAWADVEVIAPVGEPFRCEVSGPQAGFGQSPDTDFAYQARHLLTKGQARVPPLIRSGDKVRVGPFHPGSYAINGCAQFEVPGREEPVSVRRSEGVTFRDRETVPLRIEFSREAIEAASK